MNDEEFITLAEAARMFPKVGGRHPHTTSTWRWCRKGFGPARVRLRYWRIGRRICTTAQAVREFMAACAAADETPPCLADTHPRESISAKPKSRTNRQREKALDSASERLQEMGA